MTAWKLAATVASIMLGLTACSLNSEEVDREIADSSSPLPASLVQYLAASPVPQGTISDEVVVATKEPSPATVYTDAGINYFADSYRVSGEKDGILKMDITSASAGVGGTGNDTTKGAYVDGGVLEVYSQSTQTSVGNVDNYFAQKLIDFHSDGHMFPLTDGNQWKYVYRFIDGNRIANIDDASYFDEEKICKSEQVKEAPRWGKAWIITCAKQTVPVNNKTLPLGSGLQGNVQTVEEHYYYLEKVSFAFPYDTSDPQARIVGVSAKNAAIGDFDLADLVSPGSAASQTADAKSQAELDAISEQKNQADAALFSAAAGVVSAAAGQVPPPIFPSQQESLPDPNADINAIDSGSSTCGNGPRCRAATARGQRKLQVLTNQEATGISGNDEKTFCMASLGADVYQICADEERNLGHQQCAARLDQMVAKYKQDAQIAQQATGEVTTGIAASCAKN